MKQWLKLCLSNSGKSKLLDFRCSLWEVAQYLNKDHFIYMISIFTEQGMPLYMQLSGMIPDEKDLLAGMIKWFLCSTKNKEALTKAFCGGGNKKKKGKKNKKKGKKNKKKKNNKKKNQKAKSNQKPKNNNNKG